LKYLIEKVLQDALRALPEDLRMHGATATVGIERTRDSSHVDFASNCAM